MIEGLVITLCTNIDQTIYMPDDKLSYHSSVPCAINWDCYVWKVGLNVRGYVVIVQQQGPTYGIISGMVEPPLSFFSPL